MAVHINNPQKINVCGNLGPATWVKNEGLSGRLGHQSRVMLVLFIALIDAVAYLIVSVTRVDALKVIDSSIFFPIFKVAASTLTIPVGVLFFSDVLSGKETLGIFVG